MKNYILLLFLLLSISSFSQIQGEDEVYLGGDLIEPKFNGGGLDKFYEYVNKEFDFSKVHKEGKLVTSFTIDENGDLKNCKVIQFVDIESATEIIRVLKKSPKWSPAFKGGNPVAISIKFPFDIVSKQQDKSEENTKNPESISNVEKGPEFIGGLSKFYDFIAKNYRAPEVAGLSGKVVVSFIVETDGTLTNIKIDEDLGYGTGIEAVRVLKKSPKWMPATQKGIPVRCQLSLPITIKN